MENSCVRGDWANEGVDGAPYARLGYGRLLAVQQDFAQLLPLLVQLPHLIRAKGRTGNVERRDVSGIGLRIHRVDDRFPGRETRV